MALHNYLDELLNGKHLPEGAALRHIIIEDSLAGKIADHCMTAAGFPHHVTLVSDANTYAAFGKQIESELSASTKINNIIFQEPPVPDMTNASQIREAAESSDLIIAVGSGTINDICKYAAFLADKPYVIFPTAPSMNGYISANASIFKKGHKHSLGAKLPTAIFCDMGIIRAAPARLIRAGFGDVMCRSTAQADWLLSHLLLGTVYSDDIFELLKPYETKLIKNAAKIPEGDKETITLLMKALLVSGMGMVMAGGSHPASQGEHLIAHCMEMVSSWGGKESYHGEQIAVTTLRMAALQDTLLTYVPNRLQGKKSDDEITTYFGPSLKETVLGEYHKKQFSPEALNNINNKISASWSDISKAIYKVRIPIKKLKKILSDAGCPTAPEDIGWNSADFENALKHAHFIRDRFTFLDVAYLSR